jgi:hypothetical protein
MGIDTAILIGVDERTIPPFQQRTIVLRLVGTYAFMMIALKSVPGLKTPIHYLVVAVSRLRNELKFRVAKSRFPKRAILLLTLLSRSSRP